MYAKSTIILDGGHGWNTAGKRAEGIRENEFNDGVVAKLSYALSLEDYDVHILAPEWHDVSLDTRISREKVIAKNTKGPTLLISIHADAWTQSKANGFSVYYYKQGKKIAKMAHQAIKHQNPLRDRDKAK